MQPTRPTDNQSIHTLAFTGSGSEYFRIWIVNIVLTVLTLGIYSEQLEICLYFFA